MVKSKWFGDTVPLILKVQKTQTCSWTEKVLPVLPPETRYKQRENCCRNRGKLCVGYGDTINKKYFL